ncbi:MAG: regulatory protein LuxR [Nocardioides sp.]|jgi:NarL family two-component system response regulator LiaR|nr:regulatory protein LuxR [Nocardioides sp.]
MTTEASRPIRVVVVDDCELVAFGVAEMLAPFSDRFVITEAATGTLGADGVDVALYDIDGRSWGDQTLEDLVGLPDVSTLIFTWLADGEALDRALAAGASGFLSKGASASELAATLEGVHLGRAPAAQGVSGVVAPDGQVARRGEPSQPAAGLSQRESEILSYIAAGASNQEIADACYLSINSVKTYIRTAYRKIGASRRSQAVLWALQNGYDPDRTPDLESPRASIEDPSADMNDSARGTSRT